MACVFEFGRLELKNLRLELPNWGFEFPKWRLEKAVLNAWTAELQVDSWTECLNCQTKGFNFQTESLNCRIESLTELRVWILILKRAILLRPLLLFLKSTYLITFVWSFLSVFFFTWEVEIITTLLALYRIHLAINCTPLVQPEWFFLVESIVKFVALLAISVHNFIKF